ncbi:MAG: peptide-methionine (S)-S-oxide reductase MsrA [Dysosmobacter sp.]
MSYVLIEQNLEEEDEPRFIYAELDSGRREVRRVEFYPNGLCFAYGGDYGREEALSCPLPGGPADAEPPRGGHRPRHHSGRVSGDLGTGPGAAGRLYGNVCLMRRSICFAGGCFWGMEALYRRLPGVLDVTAGYANGDTADHANYDDVCTGRTGFREAVQVAYEDGTVSLPHLLFVFFAAIDPETPNRQGPDVGSQYQTGVYWMDPADEGIIRSIAALEAAAVPFFAVELKPLACFYPAEEFHQRYLEKHPRGYCHVAPWKLAALPDFPFSTKTYTRPAKELLQTWKEAGEVSF